MVHSWIEVDGARPKRRKEMLNIGWISDLIGCKIHRTVRFRQAGLYIMLVHYTIESILQPLINTVLNYW